MKLARLNALRALEATLRLGSFRAAADEIGVTPAAVGQQVRGLEAAVGRALLRRGPAGLAPTDETASVAPRLTEAFRGLAAVAGELSQPAAGNRLALTMTQGFAEGWLPPELPDFFAQVGALDLRIDTTPVVRDLGEGAFDFAVRSSGPVGEGLCEEVLAPGSLVPLCTPSFARRYGLTPATRTLDGVPLAHVDTPTSDPGWLDWDGWCAARGMDTGSDGVGGRIEARLSHGPRVAQAGLALVLCGLVEARHAMAEGSLVAPFGPGSVVVTRYHYRLVWLRDRRLTPVQRRFRDWVVDRTAPFRGPVEALVPAWG